MQQKDSSENSKDGKSKSSRSESGASSTLSETNFFYTSDKFFNTFEDDEITYYI